MKLKIQHFCFHNAVFTISHPTEKEIDRPACKNVLESRSKCIEIKWARFKKQKQGWGGSLAVRSGASVGPAWYLLAR